MNTFVPEGVGFLTPENQKYTASVHALKEAFRTGRILEAKAVRCDREHNLYVQFPGVSGVMPFLHSFHSVFHMLHILIHNLPVEKYLIGFLA